MRIIPANREEEEVEEEEVEPEPEILELLPEVIDAMEAFEQVQDCWKYGAMGGILGLNYLEAGEVFNRLRYEVNPDVYRLMRVFANEVAKIWNQKAKEEQDKEKEKNKTHAQPAPYRHPVRRGR